MKNNIINMYIKLILNRVEKVIYNEKNNKAFDDLYLRTLISIEKTMKE